MGKYQLNTLSRIESLIPSSHKVPGQRYAPNFIIYRILGQPIVDVKSWRLVIDGLVKRKLIYTYNELMSMDHVKLIRDFHCVTGWSVKQVVWKGVRLRELVKDYISSEVRWAYVYGLDGYIAVIPIEDFISDDSILALKINGKPLTSGQGFSARVFVPHLYGWKSVK